MVWAVHSTLEITIIAIAMMQSIQYGFMGAKNVYLFIKLTSLKNVDVTFPAYNALQLQDILKYRSEHAFYPHTLGHKVIDICAGLAAQRNGDARYALDLLSTAANLCEEEGRYQS
ncbi:MAG: hypothetical protein WCE81_06080 [Halobacteriota archaeon]